MYVMIYVMVYIMMFIMGVITYFRVRFVATLTRSRRGKGSWFMRYV